MTDYLEMARQVSDAMAATATPDSPNELGTATLPKCIGFESVIRADAE
jgi:hypothetical protein